MFNKRSKKEKPLNTETVESRAAEFKAWKEFLNTPTGRVVLNRIEIFHKNKYGFANYYSAPTAEKNKKIADVDRIIHWIANDSNQLKDSDLEEVHQLMLSSKSETFEGLKDFITLYETKYLKFRNLND